MKSIGLLMVAAVLLVASSGCVARPKVFDPGTEHDKQARAQRFDPYPQTEMGPMMTGARPREFQNPPPEVLRVQPQRGVPVSSPVGYPYAPPSLPGQ